MTRKYAFFDHNDSVSQKIMTDRLNACIREIRTWATHNELVLNDNKTEIVHLSSKFISRAVLDVAISVGNSPIIPSKEARNLGSIFDEHLTMKSKCPTYVPHLLWDCPFIRTVLLKFLSEIYSPVRPKRVYERCVRCFSQSSQLRLSPVQFDCVLRAVQCVLCALCAKMQVHDFRVPHEFYWVV